jgi:NADPH-dependent glutamate synthase beta subunit-like oxidoreductase/Pyruvate/2-oxoacid:ferredoxin oxidoreductase delta subunit
MSVSSQSQGKTIHSVSLSISQSHTTTQGNNTGTWRFVRPKYENKTAPCSVSCPLGVDIAMVEMLVARKEFKKAHETLLIENPFPAICGRVCFHPCEKQCNRQYMDESVGIHTIERYIGDWGVKNNLLPDHLYPQKNGSKIAVVGSGPAGLAVAYFSRRLGYACDIFEQSDICGGLLNYGIPEYRLPKDILATELQRLNNDDINVHTNEPITFEKINSLKLRYDAVFLCCGDALSIQLKIPGEDKAIDGLQLLKQIRMKTQPKLNGHIAIIGGGNTAIDVARSLLRLGAHPIIVYRRTRKEMPAHSHEIDAAIAEGIVLKECLSPEAIEAKANGLCLTLQKMKASDHQSEERQTYIPDDDRKKTMTVNHIVTAIGAEKDMMWHRQSNQWDLQLSHCSMQHNDIPFFWCGDLSSSEKTVTHALASGKQAVLAFDILRKHGQSNIPEMLNQLKVAQGRSVSFEMYLKGKRQNRSPEIVSFDHINTAYFTSSNRLEAKQISIEHSITSFDEIISTFQIDQVVQEAKRCFNCGLCNDCDTCRIFCPEMAIQSKGEDRHILMEYCKGCGICIVECPRNAMALEVEP